MMRSESERGLADDSQKTERVFLLADGEESVDHHNKNINSALTIFGLQLRIDEESTFLDFDIDFENRYECLSVDAVVEYFTRVHKILMLECIGDPTGVTVESRTTSDVDDRVE